MLCLPSVVFIHIFRLIDTRLSAAADLRLKSGYYTFTGCVIINILICLFVFASFCFCSVSVLFFPFLLQKAMPHCRAGVRYVRAAPCMRAKRRHGNMIYGRDQAHTTSSDEKSCVLWVCCLVCPAPLASA